MTIELNPITSGYSTGLINDNFQAIEDYVNDKLLQRDGVETGEINQMEVDLDMNSHFVFNLPEPTLEHQAARLQDVKNAIAGGSANLIDFTPYSYITAENVQTAIQQVADSTIGNLFDSVSALSSSSEVSVGDTVATLGYYTPGDGGGNRYKIVAAGTGTEDGGEYINLSTSGLQAEGVFEGFVVSVKQFGTVGDGVDDDSSAIQSCLLYANSGKTVYVPKGEYRLASPVVVDKSADPGVYTDVVIWGQDPQTTIFTVDGTENSTGAFRFIKDGGVLLNINLKGFQILAKSETGNCGIGIYISSDRTGAEERWGVVMEDVYTDTEDRSVTETGGVNDVTNPAHFSQSYSMTGIGRAYLKNVIANHPQQTNGLESPEITFADDSSSYLASAGLYMEDVYKPNLDHCTFKNCSTGVILKSVDRPVEGFVFTDVAIVNVKTGLRVFKDALSPAGVEPEFAFIGGHINFRDRGILIEHRQEGIITGMLFYHSNSDGTIGDAFPTDIQLINSRFVKISDNEFARDLSRTDRRMIWLESIGPNPPADTRNVLTVTGNNFNATAESAVHIVPDIDMPTIDGNNYSSDLLRHIRFVGNDIRGNASPQNLSGRYVPTVLSSTNVDSTGLHEITYVITGSVIQFTGVIGIDATSADTLTEVELSLPPHIPPLASSVSHNVRGCVTMIPDTWASESGAITASASDNILIQVYPSSVANRIYTFTGALVASLNNV